MKRILITGANSCIGRAFAQSVRRLPGEYEVARVSLRDGRWKETSFSPYETVLHTAGLAHVKESRTTRPLFDSVNRRLTAEAAEKAREEGVRQFIFLSSMSVYGMEEGVITPDTVPRPAGSYGRSKLEAEERLREIETEDFRVAILRLPMVYGRGCKGNYQALVKLAGILPVCPDYQNRRSMISIERLCEDIRQVIDSGAGGTFFLQDPEYVCTCRMICRIAEEQGRRLPRTKALNFGPALLKRFTKSGRKAFGDLIYQDDGQCDYAGVQRRAVHRGGSPVRAASDLDGSGAADC